MLFLSEAFTRPAMMHNLAIIGFHQSYTYFTWRNSAAELTEYLLELSGPAAAYMRPNFFVNTPDILTEYLQHGGPPAFRVRAVLAATLSPTWGVYSGYELCENVPLIPGSEEYLDSEKYQYRPRDWAARRKHPPARRRTSRRSSPASTCSASRIRPCTSCGTCVFTTATSRRYSATRRASASGGLGAASATRFWSW